MPPELEWEQPIWRVYEITHRQLRVSLGTVVGLDFNPAIAIFREKGWNLELSLELLNVIEDERVNVDG